MVLHVLHFLLQWGHVDGECGEGGWEGDRWGLSHFELYQCEPEEPTCGRGRGREGEREGGEGGGKEERGLYSAVMMHHTMAGSSHNYEHVRLCHSGCEGGRTGK